MEHRVLNLGVHATSLIAACMSAVMGIFHALLLVPLLFAMSQMMMGHMELAPMPVEMPLPSLSLLAFIPVFYFVGAYIATAILITVFNVVAPRLGGVPITLSPN